MIIGIDIGTSYSSVCFRNSEGKAEPVEISTGLSIYGSKYSLPSAVFVNDDKTVVVGQAAMNNRKLKPQNFRAEFKRDLGQTVPVMLGDRSFMPEDFYTELFLHMKACIKKINSNDEEIEKVYITYPATFGQTKKDKIINAAKAAGLFNVELVDEPTAAAMCYAANGVLKNDGIFLVYDFGGGTFDTALIECKNGCFKSVAAPSGIEHCGGIDIDRLIYSDIMAKIPSELQEMLSANPLNKLRLESQIAELSVKIKHSLSSSTEATEIIPVGFDVVEYSLNRDTFNNMIADIVENSIECCREMLANEQMNVSDLSGILLIGGTSRVVLIREKLEKFANGIPVYFSVDPELAVSQGAIEYLAGNSEEDTPQEPQADSILENIFLPETNDDVNEPEAQEKPEKELLKVLNVIQEKKINTICVDTPANEFELGSIGNNYSILKYKGNRSHVKIPETINGRKVVSIGTGAFGFFGGGGIIDVVASGLSQKTLEIVDIPKSVTVIGNGAFSGCSKLRTVKAHENIERIGNNAFAGCASLETIDFGMGCDYKNIKFPPKLKEIGSFAFTNSNYRSGIVINEATLSKKTKITHIMGHAFAGQNQLAFNRPACPVFYY